MTIGEQIHHCLTEQGVRFKALHHEPTRTSEDSARVRGESLSIGAKAIVMKVEKEFRLFVLSAASKIDPKSIRVYFKAQGIRAKKIRFATTDELMDLTGLVPGSVPPFGRPILDLPLYVDPALLDNDRVAFNAGSLTDSIIMQAEDYARIAQPVVFPFVQSD